MTAHAFASGRWQVREGEADEFIHRWEEFLGWTRENYDELVSATLIRSEADPHGFLSSSVWDGVEGREEWKNSEGFMERFTSCRQLCDDFDGGDFAHVVAF